MDTHILFNVFDVSLGVHRGYCILLKKMSNSNTTQETLEIMKESEKKLVEESVNKNKFISKTPSKEEIEKESEDTSTRQETQVRTRSASYAHSLYLNRSVIVGGSGNLLEASHLYEHSILPKTPTLALKKYLPTFLSWAPQ